jgi:hypothetical protein
MTSAGRQSGRSILSAGLGMMAALLGLGVFNNGLRIAREWPSISSAYAACAVAWMIAGPAMIIGGLWALGSLGRHKTSLWLAAAGSMLSGVLVIVGVLSSVIPCSGPT